MGQGLSLTLSIGVPLAWGTAFGLATRKDVTTWYKDLKKPKWTPPNWLFGPAWTILYGCMGTAAWLIWRDGGFKGQRLPLMWYGAQLLLNFLWTPLFFKAHSPTLALVDITALDVTLAVTTALFFEQNRVAGGLLVPYLGWTLFATALTADIVRKNRHETADKEEGATSSAPPPVQATPAPSPEETKKRA